ncbi:MAG: DnaJ domain-containing protein [Labilithrix sp.]|nr:DnaJ domain-containing protein [Labilithrix sp.]
MNRDTVLVRIDCDLRRLPINAKEAFFVSQLDGRITLEEASEIAGLALDEGMKLAGRLSILGAVRDAKACTGSTPSGPRGAGRSTTEKRSRPPRSLDPRAEVASERPPRADVEEAPRKTTSRRLAAQVRKDSPPGMRKERRRSTGSMPEVCELDAGVQEMIRALDTKLAAGVDHYAALGVERTADKKEITRAYFALAAQLHPDRFFGKKLGPLRAAIDRVFTRLTAANDELATSARRATYDATLPPPKKPSSARRPSKRMRRSQLTPAVAVEKPPEPPPSSSTTNDPERFKKLQAAARNVAGAERAMTWVRAAEEAVRAGDIVGAANNYRLALQMHDDPVIRQKLDAIDAHSRDLRHEKYLLKGRAAERALRWAEAADHYTRANEVRREASVAERAANALRLGNGDLRQATALAEQAVAHDAKNADYRVTLGEVYLASGLVQRAKDEADAAIKLSPSYARAKALVAAVRARS